MILQDPARSQRTSFRDLILPQVYNKLSYDEWSLIMMQEEKATLIKISICGYKKKRFLRI